MPDIVLIAHNLRSCHNVGSLLRTADGLGVTQVILSGYTPYPLADNDDRLPHLAAKINKQIKKTALGAETTQRWIHAKDITSTIAALRAQGYIIAGVEQHKNAILLPRFDPPAKIVLLFGREVEGVEPEVLAACDMTIEIPMFGSKESFNVTQAAAMAMYHCRFVKVKA